MRGWLRALACLAVALLAIVALRVIRAEREIAPAPTQTDLQALHGIPVEVAAVSKGQLTQRIRLFGTIEGEQQAEVIAATPNVLQRVHVHVGEEVRSGKVLASMRDVALSPLGFRHEPLRAQYDATRADLERIESLHAQGAVTDQQVEHARAMTDAARADYEAAVAAIRIPSPIDGTVTRIDFREGEMVPNDRPLMQIAQIDTVMVELMAESVDVAAIEMGQTVEVRATALPDRTFTGQVVERSLAAYPVLNQFRVRISIPNAEHLLLPGYPVDAEILAHSEAEELLVPSDALTELDGAPIVWVVGEGSAARRVGVEPGRTDGERVAVTGDLAPGDRVVTLGKEHIPSAGSPLRVIEQR